MADWASAVLPRNKPPIDASETLSTPYQAGSTSKIPSNDLDTNIPTSTFLDPDRPSLVHLPTELRLHLWDCVLAANNVPRSYAYTRNEDEISPQDPEAKPPTFTKHGPVLVSKKFSAEYRQAYYEHTRFFFHINSLNAFEALPQLAQGPRLRNSAFEKHVSTLPNFWNASDKLLSSLRHCVLYIEIGDIASESYSAHSVSRVVRANISLPEARRVRMEMKTFNSHAAMKEQDSDFDLTLINAIQRLIRHMAQLRSVQLVWNLDVVTPARNERFSTSLNTDWSFRTLGEPFVVPLQAKRMLRRFEVKVGDKWEDTIVKGERGEGGKWIVRRQ
ncbi:hypothetical protein BDV96DRAFT_640840 [Lophiotrema nucula]|uniref:Uncharacterized protein n=1 Tax=Lophiotrema nucula TaxID=690887 RepID=A0A6A5ZT25_9PLEO|nr:hypothetical protein BDV96DRAFT_640840 [Lophiotrema nucula]